MKRNKRCLSNESVPKGALNSTSFLNAPFSSNWNVPTHFISFRERTNNLIGRTFQCPERVCAGVSVISEHQWVFRIAEHHSHIVVARVRRAEVAFCTKRFVLYQNGTVVWRTGSAQYWRLWGRRFGIFWGRAYSLGDGILKLSFI